METKFYIQKCVKLSDKDQCQWQTIVEMPVGDEKLALEIFKSEYIAERRVRLIARTERVLAIV